MNPWCLHSKCVLPQDSLTQQMLPLFRCTNLMLSGFHHSQNRQSLIWPTKVLADLLSASLASTRPLPPDPLSSWKASSCFGISGPLGAEFPPPGKLSSLPVNTPTLLLSTYRPPGSYMSFLREAFVHTPKFTAETTCIHSQTCLYGCWMAKPFPQTVRAMRVRTEPDMLTILCPTAASVLGRSTSLMNICFRMDFLCRERI